MKKFSLGCLALLVMVIGLNSAHAQLDDTEDAILYVDFEDGVIPEELQFSDAWELIPETIDDEEYQVMSAQLGRDSDEGFIFYPPEGTTGNYSFEMRLQLSRPESFSIYTRLDGEQPCDGGYTFDYAGGYNTGAIYRFMGGPNCELDRLTTNKLIPLIPLAWYTMRVDVNGNTISFYVNDTEMVTVDDSRHTTGAIGFRVTNELNTTVQIDYVAMLPLGDSTDQADGDSSTSTTLTLENYNAQNWQDTIAELEALELIPTEGGALLFRENYVFVRAGTGYIPLARNARLQDVVISATISTEISGEDVCAILFRFLPSEQLATIVELQAEETLMLDDNSTIAIEDVDWKAFDIAAENHVLIVAIGERIQVFLNGVLTLEADNMPLREGSFGLGLFGDNDSSCEATPFWVYRYQ